MSNNETRYSRPKKLINLLKQLGLKGNDTINWLYYGYGIPLSTGTCKINDLPVDVKFAKCFMSTDSAFYVDGAL